MEFGNLAGRSGFNPRSPCGERHLASLRERQHAGFQPTLPLRGATICALYEMMEA